MKKTIICALLLLGSVLVGHAQASLRPRIEVGGNLSTLRLSSDDYVQPDTRLGLRVAGGLEMDITYWSMASMYASAGLTYRMMGFENVHNRETYSGSPYTLGYASRLHQLTLPLQMGLRFATGSSWSIALETGPYGAYSLAQVTTEYDYSGRDTYSGFGEYDKRIQLGWGLSALAEYKQFYLRIGYETDLTPTLRYNAQKEYGQAAFATIGVFL